MLGVNQASSVGLLEFFGRWSKELSLGSVGGKGRTVVDGTEGWHPRPLCINSICLGLAIIKNM